MNVRSLRILALPAFSLSTLLSFGQGDNCASAVAVTPGTYFADGPGSGAGSNNGCYNDGLGPNADWYVFTPIANGTMDVRSCLGGADTRMSVFSGTCASLTCIGFSDDFCEMTQGGSFFASEVDAIPVTGGQSYYIQWDDRWTPASFNWDLLFHCANAPQSTYNVTLDCVNGVFYIDITITNMGSAQSVNITNNGGAPDVNGVGLGTHTIGPFFQGSVVQYTLVNTSDPGCDFYSVNITNFPCPIVSCGPDNYTYCYGNSEVTNFVYQGTTSFPIALLFNSGAIYQFGGDLLTIYDGLNDLALPLYSGMGNFGDLSGMMFISTNPDHALTLQISSDAFTSCQDGGVFPQWDYTVGCLDCTPPSATFDVVLDCANNQFFIEVDLTDLGSDPALDILNDGGAPALNVSAPGVYSSGPFPAGALVQITLSNDQNSLCNIESATLTNSPCPTISCGPDNYLRCYPTNWDTVAVYQSANTFPVAVVFNEGTMEPCCDFVTVYDGPDELSTPIYSGNNGGDLTGLIFVSTNVDNALTLHFTSDFSIDCQTSFGYTPLNWTVSCLDCTNPEATFTLVPDCIHLEYNILVDVTNTGTATNVDVVNSLDSDTAQNLTVGQHLVGPFGMDSTVTLTVLNGDNPLCRIYSPPFTFPSDSCVIVSCGFDNYNYCYENSDEAWFVYQAAGPYPITLAFTQGDMLADDKIVLYNGFNDISALIYNGNNGGDLTNVAFNSNNPDNALALRVISDPSGSCADGQAPNEMQWYVACGFVGIGEVLPGSFMMYPNPVETLLNVELTEPWFGNVQMQVTDLTGRVVIDQQLTVRNGTTSTIDMAGLQNGNYVVQLITDRWVKAQQVSVAR